MSSNEMMNDLIRRVRRDGGAEQEPAAVGEAEADLDMNAVLRGAVTNRRAGGSDSAVSDSHRDPA